MTDATDDMEYGAAMLEAHMEAEADKKAEEKEKQRLINFVKKEVRKEVNYITKQEKNMFDLKNPIKGIENTKPRILLYAMPKVGKTTFASKFANHLLINLDGSSERVDCVRTPRIKSSREVLTIIDKLQNEQHDYKCLIIDTVDWLEKLICDEVAEANGKKTVEDISYGRGFPLVVNRWRDFLEALDALRLTKNMTILMLSHADIKKYTPPFGEEYDIYSPKLYGKKEKSDTSLAIILEFSDIIAFAHNKIRTKEIGEGFGKRRQPLNGVETVLYTGSSNPCFIAGNRYSLREEMPFSYEEFAADFAEKTKGLKTRKPIKEFKALRFEETNFLRDIAECKTLDQAKALCNNAAKALKNNDPNNFLQKIKEAYIKKEEKLNEIELENTPDNFAGLAYKDESGDIPQ
jgi:hypothetical protein